MTVTEARARLLDVAIKYGQSMTEIAAAEHKPKDAAFRMSLARAYVTYRNACRKAKKAA